MRVERRETMRFPLTTPSNYYLVDVEGSRILVDAGGVKLDEATAGDATIILTHWHWDHSYGITGLESPTVCASRLTGEILSSMDRVVGRASRPLQAMGMEPGEGGSTGEFFESLQEMYAEIVEAYRSSRRFEIQECPAPTMEVYPCPGHAEDHHCIKLGDYLFVGDNVTAGESPTTINYREYIETVERILALEWRSLAPGHGALFLGRWEALEYFKTVLDKKNRKMARVIALLARGVGDFNTLLRLTYGVEASPLAYVQARTLIGYLKLLEDYGVVSVDYDGRPWRISLVERL